MERDPEMGPALRNRVDDDDDDDDTDDEELLVEEREAEMVSFLNPDRVAKRKAWFLASTGNVSKTTPLVPSNYKSASCVAVEDPKFQFKGWCSSPRQWEQWVAKLLPKFGQTWKKVGIFEAILISTYKIRRDPTSISALISHWCDETNTFIFPWGEVTVTLEDIIILSGLSVLGESVKSPIPAEMMEIDQRLNDERLKFNRSTSKKAHHSAWMKVFMERDSDELEHAAFLSLWLSRFVFPCHPEMTIRPHVFPIAIRLSYGQRIALAPSVLASIYRDLREMKRCLVNRSSGMKDGSLVVWAPFHILQIWIWERFPGLRPETQNLVKDGEPRAARWHDVGKKLDLGLVQSVLSTPSSFQYRPYAISSSNWYKEGCVELIRDNELRSFAQCLCTCELVGIDTIEQYLPNRVAMQFGFDQDLPDPFSRVCHLGWEAAWRTYEITADNIGLYVPPQPFEPGISVNYLSWWREYMLACCNAGIVGMGGGMPHIMGSRDNSKGKNKSGSKKARVSSPGDKKRKIQDCYNSTVSDSVESKACDIHEVGPKGTKGAKSLSHRLSFEDTKDVIGDGSGSAPHMSNPTEVIMETGGDIPSQVSDSVEDGRVIAFMEMKSITGDVLKKVIKEDTAIKLEKVTAEDDKRNKEQAAIDRSEGSHPLQPGTAKTQTGSSEVTSGGPKIMPSLSVSITQSVDDANTMVDERIAEDLNLTPRGGDTGSSRGLIQVSVQGLSQAIKTSDAKVQPRGESEGKIELDGREQEKDSHQNVRKETISSESLNAELNQKEEKKQGEVGENKLIELDLLTNCGINDHRDRNTNNDESLVEASEEKNRNNPKNDKQIDRPLAPVAPASAENNTDMAMNEDREGYIGLHLQIHPSRMQGKGSRERNPSAIPNNEREVIPPPAVPLQVSRERISSRGQPPGPADAAAPSTLGGISKDRSGMPAVHGRTSTGVSSMDRYAAELRVQRANKEAKELADIKKLKQELKDMKHSIMMMEEGPSPS